MNIRIDTELVYIASPKGVAIATNETPCIRHCLLTTVVGMCMGATQL